MLHYSFILQKATVHLFLTVSLQAEGSLPGAHLQKVSSCPAQPSPWHQMVPCLGQPFSSPGWLVTETTQSLLCAGALALASGCTLWGRSSNPQNYCHSTGLYPAPPNFAPPRRVVSRTWCELLQWSRKEITSKCHIQQPPSKLTAGEEEGVKWGIGKHQKKWCLLIPTFGKGTLLEMVWWHNAQPGQCQLAPLGPEVSKTESD